MLCRTELMRRLSISSSVKIEKCNEGICKSLEDLADEDNSQRMLNSLFQILEDKYHKDTVSVSKFLSIIESSGILLNDPRLRETMLKIAKWEKLCLESDSNGRSSNYMDHRTFCGIARDNIFLLDRIMRGDLVIPEFPNFKAHIQEIHDSCASNASGKSASYIPQLSRMDSDIWAVSVCTVDGQRCNAGETHLPFCVQSSGKPLNYALALTELGSETVHQYVGYEPSGVTHNTICLNDEKKPHNPLINSGAIVVTSLLQREATPADRFDYVINEYKKMAGYENVGFSNSTFLSERNAADRNFAISYYMKENKCFPPGAKLNEIMDFYLQLCAIEVTCESTAVMAGTLANGGVCPITGERVFSSAAVRDTLSVMHSCGMYDYSGQFAFKVGLPAKSSVTGAIMLVIPNLMGICMWSPNLDRLGNSCRGIQFCEELVNRFNFHNFDSLIHEHKKFDPRKSHVEAMSIKVVELIFSAYNNDVTSLRRLYLSGMDMSQRDYDSRTALHVATAEGHFDAVEFLVEVCTVPLTPEDRWGFTPLDEAVRFSHAKIGNYLREQINHRLHIENTPSGREDGDSGLCETDTGGVLLEASSMGAESHEIPEQ